MKTRIRATILLASCVTALAAAGADIDLPAMPVGGKLRGQFTLTANGKPLSDIRVTLTPLKACATFDGRSSIDVTTDPTGTASFELTAGTTRGACVIEGRNGTTVAHAATTIYRPADLKVAEHSNYRYHHREMLLGHVGNPTHFRRFPGRHRGGRDRARNRARRLARFGRGHSR